MYETSTFRTPYLPQQRSLPSVSQPRDVSNAHIYPAPNTARNPNTYSPSRTAIASPQQAPQNNKPSTRSSIPAQQFRYYPTQQYHEIVSIARYIEEWSFDEQYQ
jgi:hypothetical protein